MSGPADRAAAIQLFRQAAEKGNRPSQARWGMALMEGLTVPANLVEGELWLRRAALAGDPEAAAVVGDIYAKGGKLPPNFAEAAMWFRRAAEAGHRGGARALGMMHLTGAGVPRDSEEAARWFRVSADAGDGAARVDLANLLLRGEGGTMTRAHPRMVRKGGGVRRPRRGVQFRRLPCGRCRRRTGRPEGSPVAAPGGGWRGERAVLVGRMLVEGRGVDANPEEGRAWIKRAADVGMVEAEVQLAELMLTGPGRTEGSPRQHWHCSKRRRGAAMSARCSPWVRCMAEATKCRPIGRPRSAGSMPAAERGHAYAQMMLGRYLARGLAGERDFDRARIWLERALRPRAAGGTQ